mgnify:FL=1
MKDITKYLEEEFDHLKESIRSAKHDYHSFIFSTVRDRRPESRTVILRDVNTETPSVTFHSDKRSKKITDIKINESVSALFYDRVRKIQLRISGKAKIEMDTNATKQIWGKMRPESKLCYMGPFVPSEELKSFTPNLPENSAHNLTEDNEVYGYSNFCRITVIIEKLDRLFLHHAGHQRLLFDFKESVSARWIAS